MDRYNNKQEKRYGHNEGGRREERFTRDSRDRKPVGGFRDGREEDGRKREYFARNYNKPEERFKRESGEGRDRDRERRSSAPFRKREYGGQADERRSFAPFRKREYEGQTDERRGSAPFRKREYSEQIDERKKAELRDSHYSKKKRVEHNIKKAEKADAELRLNRYISMGGVCSRRDADTLIAEGRVRVNGAVVQTVGVKVKRSDKIEVDGMIVVPERKVYIVLNKPKDYVTTMDDPQERKTVMSLIEDACKERVYPVGRLDRQTTGVLLFTNDGELSKKLTHPKYEHKKIYHVFLERPLEQQDMAAIGKGIELEDGPVKADEISCVSTDRTQVGIEIHSGRNRVVRRIFEHLGYQIVKLDRVYFAGITKKNLPRGKWRFLTKEEVQILKVY